MIGVGLHLVSSLVVTMLCAAGISIVVQPVGRFLRDRGAPQLLSTSAMIMLVLLVTAGFGALVSLGISDLQEALPEVQKQASEVSSKLFPEPTKKGILRIDELLARFRPDFSVAALVADGLFSAANTVTSFAFTILIAVFMLLETAGMRRKLDRLAERWPRISERFERSASDVQRYLFIKFLASLLTGVGALVTCVLLDVPTPLTWGVLAFSLNFVPAVGSLFAAIPPVTLALLTGDPYAALTVAAAYVALNVVIGNVLEPRVMGRHLGLSPLVVLLSVVLWGIVLGPVGALVSAPLTVVLRIFCSNSPRLEWVAVMLSPAPRGSTPERERSSEGSSKDGLSPAPNAR